MLNVKNELKADEPLESTMPESAREQQKPVITWSRLKSQINNRFTHSYY